MFNYRIHSSEAALQGCFYKEVFWKYRVNLQENTHAEVWFVFFVSLVENLSESRVTYLIIEHLLKDLISVIWIGKWKSTSVLKPAR